MEKAPPKKSQVPVRSNQSLEAPASTEYAYAYRFLAVYNVLGDLRLKPWKLPRCVGRTGLRAHLNLGTVKPSYNEPGFNEYPVLTKSYRPTN